MSKQTCPYRMEDFGPWDRREGMDDWLSNPDGTRTCSFCGSLHHEDFERLIDRCLEVGDVQIDPSTKGGKWYVHRPEVKNAGDGGIKFKSGHCGDDEWVARVNEKLAPAVEKSMRNIRSWIHDNVNKPEKGE